MNAHDENHQLLAAMPVLDTLTLHIARATQAAGVPLSADAEVLLRCWERRQHYRRHLHYCNAARSPEWRRLLDAWCQR